MGQIEIRALRDYLPFPIHDATYGHEQPAGVAPADILHASFADSTAGPIPYVLMLDRRSQCVVLSVRGTGEGAAQLF